MDLIVQKIIKLLSCFIIDKNKRVTFRKKWLVNNKTKEYGAKVANNILSLLSLESDTPQLDILKENLRVIEIETFSYCNRQCWFCPNSFIDRHTLNILMDENLYLKILNELKEIDYKDIITFSRYNEPFADRIILKRLKQARNILPKVQLYTHSNGDYLTKNYLDEIARAGLNTLKWQYYLQKNEEFNPEKILNNMDKRIKNLNLTYEIINKDSNSVNLKVNYPNIDIEYQALNFAQNGCNRGDTLDTISAYDRKSPCYVPFEALYIDYNGKVMPCCNLRSDIEAHNSFIMGDANKQTLAEIFTSNKMVNLRRNLIGNSKKIAPCNSCSFGTWKQLKCMENVYVK